MREVEVVSPSDGYKTVPLITYSEIRLALNAQETTSEFKTEVTSSHY